MELDETWLHTKFLDCEKLNISSRYSTDREDKEETRSFA